MGTALSAALLRTLLLAALSAAAVGAAELQVNSYTFGNQRYPAVGRADDGSFVVAWEGGSNQDGSSYGVFAQRFDSDGARLGAELQINLYTPGAQSSPALAMTGDGRFVVAWASLDQDGSDSGIFARRFESSGAAAGGELQVNAYTPYRQIFPTVAIADDGSFVVAWQSPHEGGGGGYGIFARRFDSSGGALSADDFIVNTQTLYTQRFPAVAHSGAGGFVVTWESREQDGSSYGVFAQRFDSGGARLGAELQVNVYTTGEQNFAAVGTRPDGSFVVAWQSGQDGSGLAVLARHFASDGAAVGGELQINASTAGSQRYPSLALEPAGGFVVAWADGVTDASNDGVRLRRFTSSGAPATGEIQVNSYTVDDQRHAAVAVGADDVIVVAWQSSQQDGLGLGVFARVVPPPAILDIDANGQVAALTDGLLTLRWLFGFGGATLSAGAVGSGCARCDSGTIASYLGTLGAQLDIDDNGSVQALSDGLLVLRYLFGFSGDTLTGGAVGDSCNRCDAAAITQHLACLTSIPTDPC